MAILDILDLSEARACVPTNEGKHDERLADMVTGISAQIDALCGPVVARAVTEAYDGGKPTIWLHKLRQSPVLSITSVTEHYEGTATVLTAETSTVAGTYLLKRTEHFTGIARRSSFDDWVFAGGRENVVVVASAGRFATTATVDAGFKEAAKSILRAQWQQETGRWAQSPQFIDDSELGLTPGYISVEDMVRRRLPHEIPKTRISGFA